MVKLIRSSNALAVTLLAAAGLFSLSGCDSHSAATPVSASTSSAAAEGSAATPPARGAAGAPAAAAPDGGETRTFTTTGPLVADQQADIGAERDGVVKHIAVQIGDRVRQGQVLAQLDDRALQAAYDAEEARVTSMQAQVAEWQAEQKTEEADLRRADIMRTEKIRSEEDWEHVKYKLDETIQEVARYKADEAVAEADLRSANLQLEQSRILAPFTGVVGRETVRIDQQVKKGDVLFWITAEAPLRVLFTVPEAAMAWFTSGAALELTTNDYPSLRQAARVLRVSPVVDPASGSVQVVGAVARPSPLLKPGMSMQIQLAQGQIQPAPRRLPQAQVRPGP